MSLLNSYTCCCPRSTTWPSLWTNWRLLTRATWKWSELSFSSCRRNWRSARRSRSSSNQILVSQSGYVLGKVEIYRKWQPLFPSSRRQLQLHRHRRNQQANGDSTERSSASNLPVWGLGQRLQTSQGLWINVLLWFIQLSICARLLSVLWLWQASSEVFNETLRLTQWVGRYW